MKDLEDFYWWFVARRNLVTLLLKRCLPKYSPLKILDIGCGTGRLLGELSHFGQASGVDISSYAVELCHNRGFSEARQGDVLNLQFASESFDIICALDVFEHIVNDKKAFDEAYRILKNKGTFLLTVPANRLLWSCHDIALEHKRRYSLAELRHKLTSAGFKIQRISYCIFGLFFPIFIFRIMQNIFSKPIVPKTTLIVFPTVINAILLSILRIENLLINKGINFPLGVSIVCVATKV
jgi:SAM-dependent methyltransferase